MAPETQAKHFIKKLGVKLCKTKDHKINFEEMKDRFHQSINCLPQGSLKKELIRKYVKYVKKLWRIIKKNKDRNKYKEEAEGDLQYNLLTPDGRKSAVNKLKKQSKEMRRRLGKHLLAEVYSDADVSKEVLGLVVDDYDGDKKSANMKAIEVENQVTLGNTNRDVLHKHISSFIRKMTIEVEEVILLKKRKRCMTLQRDISNFLLLVVFQNSMITSVDEKKPHFEDLLAAVISLYLDVEIYLHRGKDDAADAAKNTILKINMLLGKSTSYLYDAVLQTTSVTAKDVPFMLPIYESILKRPPDVVTNCTYIKYMSTVKQVLSILDNKYKDKVDLIKKEARKVSVPPGFLQWIKEISPNILDDVPLKVRSSGDRITNYILKEASTEFIDSLIECVEYPGEINLEDEENEFTVDGKPLFFVDKSADETMETKLKIDFSSLTSDNDDDIHSKIDELISNISSDDDDDIEDAVEVSKTDQKKPEKKMKKSSSKSKKKAKVVQMLNSETNLSVDSDMKDEEESNIKKLKRKKKTARMVCSTSRTEERSSTEKTTKKKKKVIIADRDDTKIGAELLESGSGIKKGNKKIKAKEGKGKTTTLKEKKKKSARLDEKGSQDQGDAQIVMKPAPKQISIMDEKEVDKKRKKKLKSKSKIIAENTADVEEEEIKYDDAETLEPNEARVVEKSLINGHQESDEDKKLRNSNKINEKCEEILEPDGMNMDKSSEKDDDNEKNEEMATIDVEQINGDKNKEIVTEEEKEGSAVDVGIPTETIIVINTETKIVDIPLKDNQIMEVEETAVNHDSDNEKKNILNLHFTDDFVPNSHDSSSASDTVKFVSKPKKKSLLSHQPKINQDGLSESCDGSKPTLTPMKKKTKSKEVRSVSKKKLKQSHDDIQESLKSKEVARKVDSKKKNAQCEDDGVDEDDGGADEVVFKSAASSDDVEQMVEIGIRHLREITPKKSSDSDGGQSKNTVKDNSLFDKDSLGESLSNEANALPTNKRTPEAIKSPDSMNVDKSQVTGVVTDEEVVIFQSDEETTKTNRGLEKSPMIHVDNKSEEQLLSISGERKEDEPTSGDLCGSTIETNNVLSEDKNHKASSITSTTKTLEKEPEKNSIPFHKRIIDVVFSSDERKSDDDIVDEIVDERSRVRTKRKSGKKTPKKAFPDEATSKAEKKSITSEIVDLASSSDIDIKSDVANEVSVVSIPRKGAKKTSKKVSVGGVTSRGDKILITQEMKDVASSSDEDVTVSVKIKGETKTAEKASGGGVTQRAENKLITSKRVDVASSSDNESDTDEDVADERSAVITKEGEKKTSKKVSVGQVTPRAEKKLITSETADVASSSDEDIIFIIKRNGGTKKASGGGVTQRAENKLITSKRVDVASSSDNESETDEDVADERSAVITKEGEKKTSKKVSVGQVTPRAEKKLITSETADVASSSDEDIIFSIKRNGGTKKASGGGVPSKAETKLITSETVDIASSSGDNSESDEDSVGITRKSAKKAHKKASGVTSKVDKLISPETTVVSSSDDNGESDEDVSVTTRKGEKKTSKKASETKLITSEMVEVASSSDSDNESDEDVADEWPAVSITRKVEKKTPKKTTVGGVTQNSAKKLITSEMVEVASSSDSESESDEDVADESLAVGITGAVEKKTSKKASVGGITSSAETKLITSEMADVEASNDSESETDEDIAGERSAVGIKTKNEKKTPKKTAVVTPNSAKKSITSEMADVASASDNESETDDDIADERSAVGIKSKGEKITPKKTTIVTPNSAKKSITSETAYVASESDSESESDEDMNDEDTAVSITRKVEKKTPKKSTVGGVTQNSAKKLITSKILEVASSSDSENESDEDIADEEPAASITTEVEKKTPKKVSVGVVTPRAENTLITSETADVASLSESDEDIVAIIKKGAKKSHKKVSVGGVTPRADKKVASSKSVKIASLNEDESESDEGSGDCIKPNDEQKFSKPASVDLVTPKAEKKSTSSKRVKVASSSDNDSESNEDIADEEFALGVLRKGEKKASVCGVSPIAEKKATESAEVASSSDNESGTKDMRKKFGKTPTGGVALKGQRKHLAPDTIDYISSGAEHNESECDVAIADVQKSKSPNSPAKIHTQKAQKRVGGDSEEVHSDVHSTSSVVRRSTRRKAFDTGSSASETSDLIPGTPTCSKKSRKSFPVVTLSETPIKSWKSRKSIATLVTGSEEVENQRSRSTPRSTHKRPSDNESSQEQPAKRYSTRLTKKMRTDV